MEPMTNRELKDSKDFIDLCKMANVKPTVRQASKFIMGKGAVYKISVEKQKGVHVPDFAKIEVN